MEPKTTIGVNKNAVVELAVFGSRDRAESLLRETHRTMKRLDAKVGAKVKVLKVPDRGAGSSANLHDVIRWLDGLDKSSEAFGFLTRVHKTLTGRVTAGFLKSLE